MLFKRDNTHRISLLWSHLSWAVRLGSTEPAVLVDLFEEPRVKAACQ